MTARKNRRATLTVATVAESVAPDRRRDGGSWRYDAHDVADSPEPGGTYRRARRNDARDAVTLRHWQEVSE